MTLKEYNNSVDMFSDGIYRFILKNIRDKDKAKDIVQETYLKLWKKVDEVSAEKVKPYLFTTAYRTMIDQIRRDKKIVRLDDIDQQQMLYTENYTDTREILDKAIDKLPEKQKAVILLRDYEGYSYNEIAEITSLNESQVKVYIYRARVFLKEQIKSPHFVI
ncbi:RNA polymerase sigma factor [Bacteroidota bacterium]